MSEPVYQFNDPDVHTQLYGNRRIGDDDTTFDVLRVAIADATNTDINTKATFQPPYGRLYVPEVKDVVSPVTSPSRANVNATRANTASSGTNVVPSGAGTSVSGKKVPIVDTKLSTGNTGVNQLPPPNKQTVNSTSPRSISPRSSLRREQPPNTNATIQLTQESRRLTPIPSTVKAGLSQRSFNSQQDLNKAKIDKLREFTPEDLKNKALGELITLARSVGIVHSKPENLASLLISKGKDYGIESYVNYK